MKLKPNLLGAAVAAAFAVGSTTAMAVVLSTSSTADVNTYASELATNGMTITDPNIAIQTVMGFGVSAAQTRYVRFDLTNAKWGAAIVAAYLDAGAPPAGITFTPVVALASGGTTSDSFVIFQVTADVAYASSDSFSFALNTPGVKVTAAGTSVGLTYSLYETASDAVGGGATGRLATKTKDIAKFGAGLKFSVTTNNSVASVDQAFKKFTSSSPTTTRAKLGTVAYTTNTTFTAAGVAVALTDLVTAATKLVVAGDFSASTSGSTAAVGLDAGGDCTTADDVVGAMNTSNTSSDITVGTTAQATGAICYLVNGTTILPEQTVTVALDLTAAGTSTAVDVPAQTLGTITHDGTTMIAPLAQIPSGWISRLVMNNLGTVARPYTVVAVSETGNTVTLGATLASGTLAVGTTVIDLATEITATGAPRTGLKIVVAAPNTEIEGLYQIVNGTTGAISNHVLAHK